MSPIIYYVLITSGVLFIIRDVYQYIQRSNAIKFGTKYPGCIKYVQYSNKGASLLTVEYSVGSQLTETFRSKARKEFFKSYEQGDEVEVVVIEKNNKTVQVINNKFNLYYKLITELFTGIFIIVSPFIIEYFVVS